MFTIRNEYGLRPRTLRRIERAIVIQSRQLHRYWRTPIARFGSGGIPVVMKEGNEVIAGHGLARGRPRILISVQPMPFIGNRFWDADWWSLSLSHEILETLADPRQTGREVCDPVNNLAYRIRGVWVSDFVLPNGRGFLRR